jgi:hypothetical protein
LMLRPPRLLMSMGSATSTFSSLGGISVG